MNIKHTIAFLLFLALSLGTAFAQHDTLIIESEIVNENDSYYNNKYQYLDINLSDEKRVIKLGIQPFKPSDIFEVTVFTIHTAVEHKLSKSFTLTSEINTILTWADQQSIHQVAYSLGNRYYLLKKQQIKNMASGNNCNGFYLSFKAKDMLSFSTLRTIYQEGEHKDEKAISREFVTNVKPEFGVGMQQKITSYLYFDSNLAINYDFKNNEPGFTMTLLFGGILSSNQ